MLKTVLQQLEKPALYQPGAPLWTHPHIAGEMLKAHLDPDTDAASYRPALREAICQQLSDAFALRPGSRVVDVGCGPGLYCRKLAEQGVCVTGVEQSDPSLRYAKSICTGLDAAFLQQSYINPFGVDAFDAAMMISQDYGVLSPEARRQLLQNILKALVPDGYFAMDVATQAAYQARVREPSTAWEMCDGGFWRAEPYLLLHALYAYPQQQALCDLYAVLTEQEETVYRNWQTFFTPQTLREELTAAGFRVEAVWSGLDGQTWKEDSPVLGVLCRKMA